MLCFSSQKTLIFIFIFKTKKKDTLNSGLWCINLTFNRFMLLSGSVMEHLMGSLFAGRQGKEVTGIQLKNERKTS